MKIMPGVFVLLGLLAGAAGFSTGCAVDSSDDPATAQEDQALSNEDAEYEYYSNDSYTTVVGTFFSVCGGGPPTRTGHSTHYIKGSYTTCRAPVTTTGCYTLIGGVETCTYATCALCT